LKQEFFSAEGQMGEKPDSLGERVWGGSTGGQGPYTWYAGSSRE